MEIGDKLELSHVVQPDDLAKNLSSDPKDDFPAVYATSKMIALMELTAARLMKPVLSNGQLSVGVNINVNHTAATPTGSTVKAVAIYKGTTGKLYEFDLTLYDESGEAGNGTHTRAIINADRLERMAARRGRKK